MNPDEEVAVKEALLAQVKEEASKRWGASEEALKMWDKSRLSTQEMLEAPRRPSTRTPTGDELRRLGLVVCEDCGAVMADVMRHQRWHDDVRAQREEFIVLVRSVRAEVAEPGKRIDDLAAEVVKAMALMETVMEAIEEED